MPQSRKERKEAKLKTQATNIGKFIEIPSDIKVQEFVPISRVNYKEISEESIPFHNDTFEDEELTKYVQKIILEKVRTRPKKRTEAETWELDAKLKQIGTIPKLLTAGEIPKKPLYLSSIYNAKLLRFFTILKQGPAITLPRNDVFTLNSQK